MTVKHDCSGKIWGTYRDVSGRVYQCTRPATVERDGRRYCWQHDPERVKADNDKRRAADKAKMDRYTARWKRRARDARLAELVTPELAELLERLALRVLEYGVGKEDARQGRELAALIREALEGDDAKR